jgi:mRNA interferase RelE/StbE
VRYKVVLTDEVRVKLRALPLAVRREIGHRLFLLEDNLSGDVKKLKGSRNEHRLRIGDYRVLFELEGRTAMGVCCRCAKGHLSMSGTLLKPKRSSDSQIEKQIRHAQAVLVELKAALEDLEDRRELAAAKKRNAGKPGTPLREAAKELGL